MTESIREQYNIIHNYVTSISTKDNGEMRTVTIKRNSRNCEKCGGKDFIQLYRNVAGELLSSIGTLPILSCTTCKNERIMETCNYTNLYETFWRDLHYFYFEKSNLLFDRERIKNIYLENPLGTRQFMLSNINPEYEFFNRMPFWSTKHWMEEGFQIEKIEKRFLWFKWLDYPTWEDLGFKNDL